MKLGICASHTQASLLQAAGWDFIEENVLTLLGAHDQPPDRWHGADFASASALPILAGHTLLPGSHPATGSGVDSPGLSRYMAIVFSRAQRVGIKTLAFSVPSGQGDPQQNSRQLVTFLSSIAQPAEDYNITIAVDPMLTLLESAELVGRVNHPAVRLLLVTREGQAISDLQQVAPQVGHVHLTSADATGHGAIFQSLKRVQYKRQISLCLPDLEPTGESTAVVQSIRDAWLKA